MVKQRCNYGGFGTPQSREPGEPCVAFCPSGTTVTGGHCRATVEDSVAIYDENDEITDIRSFSIIVSTTQDLVDQGYSCKLDPYFEYSPGVRLNLGLVYDYSKVMCQRKPFVHG